MELEQVPQWIIRKEGIWYNLPNNYLIAIVFV